MLFSELYKIMVNTNTLVSFSGAIAPTWIRPWLLAVAGKIAVDLQILQIKCVVI